jgi:hypothetical protein
VLRAEYQWPLLEFLHEDLGACLVSLARQFGQYLELLRHWVVICSCDSSHGREYALGLKYKAGRGAAAGCPTGRARQFSVRSVAITQPSRQAMPRMLVAAVPLGTDQVLLEGADTRCI